MRTRPGHGAIAACTLAVLTALTACDSRPSPEPPDAAEAPGAGVETAADSAPEAAADTGAGAAWRPLAVPGPSEPDTYPLLIRNPHDVPLVVLADGGAGEVLLDTVSAGDSTRVKLLIAADAVTLRAVAADGAQGPPERVSLARESESRWDVRF